MKVLVEAVFNGESGSLGYKKEETYLLQLQWIGSKVICERKRDGAVCEYSTTISFLRNWKNVSLVI